MFSYKPVPNGPKKLTTIKWTEPLSWTTQAPILKLTYFLLLVLFQVYRAL